MRQAPGSNDHDSHDFARALAGVLRRALPGLAGDALTAVLVGIALWLATLVEARFAEVRVEAEAPRIERTAATNRTMCDKWGVLRDTAEYVQCTRDLQRIHNEDLACRLQHLMSD